MAENPKPHFFSPCDVARIAKNCVEDTEANEIDVIVCVAKQLGYNFIAVNVQEFVEDFAEQRLQDVIDNFSPDYPDDAKVGKIRISKIGKWFRGLARLNFRLIQIGLEFLGLEAAVKELFLYLWDIEVINIADRTRADEGKDDEEKEICDCRPKNKGNDWEKQKRNPDGTFA